MNEGQQTADNPSILFPPINWGEPVEPDGEFVLPVGTVTMLLADVEGSTRRWEEDAPAMANARAELRDMAGELIGRHNGVRPLDQGEGDSFVGAFARPSEAVACALDIQQGSSLPLRIGIHVGEVQRTQEGNYIGPALNRAARVRDTGHGGQIVLSQAAAELVAEKLPVGSSLRDLGIHRLRDLSRPERIYQLVHPSLRGEFPPLRSLEAYRHNLPVQPTTFVGRQQEMREIEGLMSESTMITLSGAGGCGKTRLALQIGARFLDDYSDGVFLCDLAAVMDPTAVNAAVANAVGFGVDAAFSLVSLVGNKHLLLILDNCEHLISASAELCQSLLVGAPRVQILATSREPLKVEGEINYVVPSLSVPGEETNGVEGLVAHAASELFLDRARRARSDFTVHDTEASVVGEICRRLDGIPLAIELAAARVRVISVREIADGLNERFQLLTGGSRTSVPRHQTLTASVDWSYDLLTDLERAVLRRLSVFVAGFTLEAAKEVCPGPKGLDIAPHQVVDLLSLLVEKSLVVMSVESGLSRFRLLETIRQYTAARLAESDEEEETWLSHCDHFLKYAEQLEVMGEGAQGVEAFNAFVRDRENFEAAFRFTCSRGEYEEAARFLSASVELLDAIWIGEAIAWVTSVMPYIDNVPEPTRTDTVYFSAPYLAHFGPQRHFEPLLRGCIEFHRESGDERRLGRALLSWIQLTEAQQEVIGIFDEAVKVTERSDDIHASLSAKASSAFRLGIDAEEQRNHYIDDLIREINAVDAPLVRFNLGWRILGKLMYEDPARAVALSEPLAQKDFESLSSIERHTLTLHPMSLAYAGRGDEAASLVRKLGPEREDVGDMLCTSALHLALALAAEAIGDSDSALRFAADSMDAFSRTGFPNRGAELLLAMLALGRDDLREAQRVREKYAAEALDHPEIARFRTILNAVSWYLEGRVEQAEVEAFKALSEAGASWIGIDPTLVLLAAIAAEDQSFVEAARLLAGSAAYRERIGLGFEFKVLKALRNRILTIVRDALSQEDFEEAWKQGSAMTIQETLSYAQRGRGDRKRPASGWRSLTPTEEQVVELLAQGMSNGEIAKRMFVSVRTVTTHLTHIYSKLDLSSRTELVAAATNRSSRL